MDERERDPRPIGIFDSGVGGLTVLAELARRFPGESFIYLGDTARVPYGAKSARTVERYTLQAASFLLNKGVKAMVAACNTASALGLAALRAAEPHLPVLGVIQPGCRAAVATTRSHRVGVIGTRSTVASGAYPDALALLEPRIRAVALACPLFVPLAEEGWLDHPATRLIVAESLAPLRHEGVDALILGCTHYPLLAPIIAEVMGEGVALVDSASAVADELEQRFIDVILPAPEGRPQRMDYLVTDIPDRFVEMARRILPGLPVHGVEMVDL
ncbi:MAG: glutamate racemase [Magnetococcales bacterium]|nr:glutamate racemase [Magnetococcales bacterium]